MSHPIHSSTDNSPWPFDLGVVHFSGIGGIGMSALAEMLHYYGGKAQGSDAAENANVIRLRAKGIPVHIGHSGQHLRHVNLVVRSSAIRDNNPEIEYARQHGIPVIRRAEMLAAIMRRKHCIVPAGTHGKTTTTSMVAAMLEAAEMDPTVINGGIINAYGSNAKPGKSEWLVAESDESDGTFTLLPVTIGIVTNIDPEHLEHYGTYENLKNSFRLFVEQIPFFGCAILCLDHPEVARIAREFPDHNILTYALSEEADVRALNLRHGEEGATFDVTCSKRTLAAFDVLKDVMLAIPGVHNVQNALAAIAVALKLGMSEATIRKALKNFQGVKRRFTLTGEVDGIRMIDDYAHHPKEILATLKTAKEVARARGGDVVAVFQPHRYSRVHHLFEDFCTCFVDAKTVLVSDIYSASEDPIEGVTQDALVKGIEKTGHRAVHPLTSPDALPRLIAELAKPGDVVVCLGAGTVTQWAYALPDALQAIKEKAVVA